MTKGEKIATIHSSFLSQEWTSKLNLNDRPLIISIPKNLIEKLGLTSESPKFNVIKDKGTISLVTSIQPAQPTDTAPKDDHNE